VPGLLKVKENFVGVEHLDLKALSLLTTVWEYRRGWSTDGSACRYGQAAGPKLKFDPDFNSGAGSLRGRNDRQHC
jgi:hypothetical protein